MSHNRTKEGQLQERTTSIKGKGQEKRDSRNITQDPVELQVLLTVFLKTLRSKGNLGELRKKIRETKDASVVLKANPKRNERCTHPRSIQVGNKNVRTRQPRALMNEKLSSLKVRVVGDDETGGSLRVGCRGGGSVKGFEELSGFGSGCCAHVEDLVMNEK